MRKKCLLGACTVLFWIHAVGCAEGTSVNSTGGQNTGNACGNGVVDGAEGETCDDSAMASHPEASCSCDDGDPCTLDSVASGSADTCDRICAHESVSGQFGYTHCNDANPCTDDELTGDPSKCDIQCKNTRKTECDVFCGNGIVETDNGEVCDDGPNSPTPCPANCDDGNLCTLDSLIGSAATCTAQCQNLPQSGYGITDCDDGDASTIDTITGGSPATCDVICSHSLCSLMDDIPDDSFGDTNCDGLDGTIDRMVFVATTGDDVLGNGTMQNPFKTVNRGIAGAQQLTTSMGVPYAVAVAEGTYSERVDLKSGISVYGGYIVQTPVWGRSAIVVTKIQNGTAANGRIEAVVADGVDSMTFDRFTVEALSAPANQPGMSVYGMRVVNSSMLSLRNLDVAAGNGSNGTDGAIGAKGENGLSGGGGANGSSQSQGASVSGGAGPTSVCGAGTKGGNGGSGGYDPNGAACGIGLTTGGNGGQPSVSCSVGTGGNTAYTCAPERNSTGGGTGSTCGNTSGAGSAAAGTSTVGSGASGEWIGVKGNDATARGAHGIGGSGGGGGGGGDCGTICRGGNGGAGGAGGSGGCGGYPGKGGTSGGSSFGVFFVGSSSIVVELSQFKSGTGGGGGKGGAGGAGGTGGGGGSGGSAGPSTDPTFAINVKAASNGGAGGAGRPGGTGGAGGGASGGVSIAQFVCNSTVTGIGLATGTAGAGGSGGTATGGPAGLQGVAEAYTTQCGY